MCVRMILGESRVHIAGETANTAIEQKAKTRFIVRLLK